MSVSCWGLLPAAGVGQRFGAALPKQYQLLCGKPVIEHSISTLLGLPLSGLLVPVAATDRHWQSLAVMQESRLQVITGGASRAQSVLLALEQLTAIVEADDWVLIHDAVRPCLQKEWALELFSTLAQDPVGGLLACPVADTLHRSDSDGQYVREAVERNDLWLAQTPQLFRFGLLYEALSSVDDLDAEMAPSDESQAVQRCGHRVRIVPGNLQNIKITVPADLQLATAILTGRESGAGEQPGGLEQ